MSKPKKVVKPADAPEAVETKEDKMVRLGTARVTRACNAIRLIGNLAAYKPTEAQIALIEETLGQSCSSVVMRLRGTRKDSFTFTLTK